MDLPNSLANYPDTWLDFDLEGERIIVGVVTAGRGNWEQWVTMYHLMYATTNGPWVEVRNSSNQLKVQKYMFINIYIFH